MSRSPHASIRASSSGKLPGGDRDAFLRAVASTRLLDVPSSTRNIGDDEEPITITVRDGNLVHEVRVWHDDAVSAGSRRSRPTR